MPVGSRATCQSWVLGIIVRRLEYRESMPRQRPTKKRRVSLKPNWIN
jgi:hypothetical protein